MKHLVLRCASLAAALCAASVFAAAPALPPGVVNTQKTNDVPLTPAEALKKITVPDGFRVSLFAGEPDVMQPIAFDFDDRGRLWVVECFSYPDFKNTNSDRIIILEDTDGDGRFDKRTVFFDKGHRLSGIAVGFGGVWVTSSPELLFIPDANGDGVPDGPPVVHLDGWTLKAGHNLVNGMTWGPDGWLYGRHGITQPSLVGKPGTPEAERVKLSCSIWRYHPTRKIFEAVTHGTTNPWGLDFDENGHAFFSNNVIGHLWHAVPGARFKRMFGEDYNPHAYGLLESCSDHLHWTGGKWQDSRGNKPEQDALGGGHSHSGGMIYLGDNWPKEYRGAFFLGNIHGNRVLFDTFERQGSGFVAKHGKSFLMGNDPWFRPVSMHYGPDGGVFVSDWNDLGECHDYDGAMRSSGRLYKVTYGAPKPLLNLDVARLSDAELVKLQLHRNDWFVRHARRVLQERAAAGKLDKSTHPALIEMLRLNPDTAHQLRALWTLHATGGTSEALLLRLINHQSEHMRWWCVQLLVEDRKASPAVLAQFAKLAKEDKSPLVRLALTSALQRLPLADRWTVAEALASHAEDAADQNLPLMLWYAIEPLVPADRVRALQLMAKCQIPQVREFITRRMAAN